MNNIKRNFGLTLAAILAVSVLAVGPASAEHGVSGDTSPSPTPTPASVTPSPTSTPTPKPETSGRSIVKSVEPPKTTHTETEHAIEAETEHATEPEAEPTTGKVDDLRSRAAKLLAADRLDNKKSDTTVAERQKACSAREANLNGKIANYGKQATAHLASLDATYAKLQAFQVANKLTVPTYDALVVTATGKQTAATSAVTALTAVTVKIDCTAPDPATSVAVVKSAVKNARVALQDYRAAIKNVLVVLMTAKKAAATTPTTTTDSTKETN